MTKRTWIALACLLCILSVLPASPAQAQSSQELDLIAEINALRASRGLAPYTVDAGLMAMAETAAAAAEGERQRAVIERWYELMPPLDENDFDEPDQERRHAEMAGREAERRDERAALYADVMAIEANLERHFPPYAELIADLRYWDDVSRIDAVRLLLVRIGDDGHLPRDRDDLVDAGVYQALPEGDRVQLATFAFTLLTPSEASRKN